MLAEASAGTVTHPNDMTSSVTVTAIFMRGM
jgi:hypothetical protein